MAHGRVVHLGMIYVGVICYRRRGGTHLRRASCRDDRDDLHHAGVHVVEKVAMECPVSDVFGRDVHAHLFRRLDHDGVLARHVGATSIDQIEEHPVQVDGMRHHRVVDQAQADSLALEELDRLFDFRELHPVERPHVALHIGGQVDHHLPLRRARVAIGLQAAELAVGQRAVRYVFQADARLVQPGQRLRYDIDDADPALDFRFHCRDGSHLDLGSMRVGTRHGRGRHGFHVVAHIRVIHLRMVRALMAGMARRRCLAVGHVAMIHCAVAHRAVTHCAVVHAHILHVEHRNGAQLGRDRLHAGARSKGCDDLAGAIDRLRHESEGPGYGRRHDDVIGFRRADLELVGLHRLHIQSVRRDDRHGKSGDSDIEDRHGRAVDDAQAHPFAGARDHVEIVRRRVAVDRIGIGRAGDIGEVAGVHAHGVPHAAHRHVVEHGNLLAVQSLRIGLERLEDPVRILKSPIRQDQHIFPVIGHRIRALGVDDHRAIMAHLLLQPGMRVIPIGAVLRDVETVGEIRPGRDARKAHARNAVHLERHEQTMPMDGCGLVQLVVDHKGNVVAFAKANKRTGNGPIDAERLAGAPVNPMGEAVHGEMEVRPGQLREAQIAKACGLGPGGKRGGCGGRRSRAEGSGQKSTSVEHGNMPLRACPRGKRDEGRPWASGSVASREERKPRLAVRSMRDLDQEAEFQCDGSLSGRVGSSSEPLGRKRLFRQRGGNRDGRRQDLGRRHVRDGTEGLVDRDRGQLHRTTMGTVRRVIILLGGFLAAVTAHIHAWHGLHLVGHRHSRLCRRHIRRGLRTSADDLHQSEQDSQQGRNRGSGSQNAHSLTQSPLAFTYTPQGYCQEGQPCP